LSTPAYSPRHHISTHVVVTTSSSAHPRVGLKKSIHRLTSCQVEDIQPAGERKR